MILYAAVASDGAIVGLGQNDTLEDQWAPAGTTLIERPAEVTSPGGWTYTNGAFVEKVIAPPSLADLKARRRALVDGVLLAFTGYAVNTSKGIVQTDQSSREVLQAKTLEALIAKVNGTTTFSIAWRLLDNTYTAAMNADEMLAFAKEITDYIQTCVLASFAAKDALDAAATEADLLAIEINSFFP